MNPEDLVALARDVLDRRPEDPERVLAEFAALRAEVDLAAVAAGERGEATLLPDLRRALEAAGLGALAPEGTPIAGIRAGLTRLHAQAAVLAATRSPRKR